ncbi:MAG: accB [Gemmataceae bacterium]|nr:accB [Gemmataceae bacterium]
MADDKQDTPRPFDVKTVEYLLKLMTDHELSEVDLKEGDQRIRLRKGPAHPVAFAPAPYPAAPPPPASGGPTSAVPPGSVSPAPAKTYHEIKSEFPGTFYVRPAPDKPEFVKVGTRVTPDTTVCIIMAMKVESPIKAGVAGTITEVCVKNEEGVGYGTVLFRVDTSA